ncbi:SpoIIAA family protein [Tateyamaria pelophila]|uniref:STAS/SEC14 domain-containing protein n=1 Tax=Tateyamaria pelophila TaxID=328415 RepID=UPI001CBEB7CB|nr:STAS/SEC14 domain-containing protein [Tateyamaria pelophila]
MFHITKTAENRLDIALSGSVDADEMGRALDDLIDQSEEVSQGLMLYTITDFAMPSMAAIGVEMSRLPKLFSLLGKFNRCAVVCETQWIRTVAEVEGALLPGLEIKAFETAEAAETWLSAGAS